MKAMRKKTDRNKPLFFREFSGLNDLTTFIENTPQDTGWSNHADDTCVYDAHWCGAKSFTDAKASLKKGAHIAEIKRAIARGAGATTKTQRTQSVIGGCLNVPAYLAGNPACMYRVDRTRSRGAYNIFVDTGVSWNISKKQVCDAGIEILIKVLQLASKYPVNLYVGDFGEYDGKILGSAVKIMDAGKAYNTARVSYALTEVGFLRVFGLAVIERNGQFWSSSASCGYGRPLQAYERRQAVETVFKNAIVLSTSEVIRNNCAGFNQIDAILGERRAR